MRLKEFQGNSSRTPSAIAKALQGQLGKLVRVGGARRFYEVNSGSELAAVYLIDGSTTAFGLAWSRDLAAAGVSSVYVWKQFDINHSPDFMVQIPTNADMASIITELAGWIRNPHSGEINEDEELTEARRTTDQEFIKMARQTFPDRAHELTLPDLMKIAQDNDVQIPTSIRGNPNLKTDAHHWNLSGGEGPSSHEDDQKLAGAMGAPIEEPEAVDPATQDILNLAKVKTVRRIAGAGKLYLMSRKANGAFFRIPGVDEIMAQLERMLARQLADQGGSDRMTMEEQYGMLKDKVKLVAGGHSAFIKSLLITGAPSSGKTFAVMQTIINDLGLKEGKDYIVKKGRITALSMYRTLIERIDGLVIFDDCDSVVDDKNGINMLKGALDTDPVREISYDVRGTLNTANLEPSRRDEIVDAISRILRNKPEPGDLERFEYLLKLKKKKETTRPSDEYDDEDEDEFDLEPGEEQPEEPAYVDEELLHEVQTYLTRHLPNKIDFRGRIIFISNMDEGDWDSAILTRAFAVNMQFTSGEMLDYIDKIKGHLKTPNLDDEQKQEVMDYLRELYTTGKLKRQVNFRLVQQAFDLRLASNWKKMVAML